MWGLLVSRVARPFPALLASLRPAVGVEQRRFKSKWVSRTASKFLPLSPKWVKKGYYKGNRCRSTGRLTSKGRFIVQKHKLLELVVPNLEGFKLKPYVAKNVRPTKYPLPGDLLASTS